MREFPKIYKFLIRANYGMNWNIKRWLGYFYQFFLEMSIAYCVLFLEHVSIYKRKEEIWTRLSRNTWVSLEFLPSIQVGILRTNSNMENIMLAELLLWWRHPDIPLRCCVYIVYMENMNSFKNSYLTTVILCENFSKRSLISIYFTFEYQISRRVYPIHMMSQMVHSLAFRQV